MKKKTSGCLLWALAVIVAVIGIVSGIGLKLGVPNGIRAAKLLEQALAQPDLEIRVSVSLSGENPLNLQADLFRRQQEPGFVYGCDASGVVLYGSGSRLILDNGRAFDCAELLPKLPVSPEQLLKLLPLAGVTKETAETEISYILTADQKKLASISDQLAPLQSVRMTMIEQEDKLSELEIFLKTDQQELSLQLELLPLRERIIPAPVLQAAVQEQCQSIRVLEPLAKALLDLASRDPLTAELSLQADCGPIELKETLMLCGTEEGIYVERNGEKTRLEQVDSSSEAMLGIGYKLFRDGQINQMGNSGSYGLTFPAESVQQFFITLIPEIEKLPIVYDDSSMLVVVDDHRLERITLICSGEMPFLFTDIPISLTVDATPMDAGAAELPG